MFAGDQPVRANETFASPTVVQLVRLHVTDESIQSILGRPVTEFETVELCCASIWRVLKAGWVGVGLSLQPTNAFYSRSSDSSSLRTLIDI